MNARPDATAHPFHAGSWNGHDFLHITVDDRLRVLKHFDAAQCRRALALTDLQITVRTALERRLRQLERAP